MMKKIFAFVFAVFASFTLHAAPYDICVYGGTSSGIIAAYTAAQMGKKVIVIESSKHWGGLTTGGLGYTDIGNKQVVTGLSKQFYRKLGKHYGSLEQWVFEPSVAKQILMDYLKHPNISILENTRLVSVDKRGGRIKKLDFVSYNGRPLAISAKYFIDCTYEGDLMAKAGVSYVVGREANQVYNEKYNGVQLMQNHQFADGIDPYKIKGDSTSGLLWGISSNRLASTGSGDTLVQAYNYRICLTSEEKNKIPITRPANYDSTRYELLLRIMESQPEKQSLNHYFIWSKMPNHKTDVNNRGGFSTDMIGENYNYPEADYKVRKKIIQAHTDYTKGLLYFVGHDSRVSDRLRKEMLKWGYPKDEFVENDHWTPQLYVREARRMVGEYVATQADCEGKTVVNDGIGTAAYTMDSHNCQRIVVRKNGMSMVKNEGNVEIKAGGPYPISYRSLLPKRIQATNLLVPVCLSASHIAYGSIRMEPVFMVLGQVSAIASCLALDDGKRDVQDVNYDKINQIMTNDPYMDHSIADILVDNTDPQVTIGEGWTLKKTNEGYAGSYLELISADTSANITFPVSIKSTSGYALYVYQHADKKQSPQTNIEIRIGDRVFRKTLMFSEMKVEGQTKGVWTPIGAYSMIKGEPVSVKILNKTAKGPLRADAILLVPEQ